MVSLLQATDLPSALQALLGQAVVALKPPSKHDKANRTAIPAATKRSLVAAIVLLLERASSLGDLDGSGALQVCRSWSLRRATEPGAYVLWCINPGSGLQHLTQKGASFASNWLCERGGLRGGCRRCKRGWWRPSESTHGCGSGSSGRTWGSCWERRQLPACLQRCGAGHRQGKECCNSWPSDNQEENLQLALA